MIALIVAYDKNRVIGNKGRIPWNIPGEQKRFRDLTLGNIVIMGRRTFEEIGRPLPGRTTIVISKSADFTGENCYTARSLSEAINIADDRNIFISGGAALYSEALPLCEKLYITEIDCEFEGDTFFPYFDESLYKKEITASVSGDIRYTYVTYTKNN
ncbi:MAG: dihydrofolate reductase [Clostridia bacterium]|nr:dihydrofolate reductase [Clostridia bacterium]